MRRQHANLINSIRCNCCKWKYKYRSLSNNSGCNWLTRCVASWTRPLCTASLINIRLSRVFNSTVGSTPASDWNFSAASLNPSVDTTHYKTTKKNVKISTHKKKKHTQHNEWSITNKIAIFANIMLTCYQIIHNELIHVSLFEFEILQSRLPFFFGYIIRFIVEAHCCDLKILN